MNRYNVVHFLLNFIVLFLTNHR